MHAREIGSTRYRFEFTICSLVTDTEQYAQMRHSFIREGFGEDCEYLYADNTRGNEYDAYKAVNMFLSRSEGKYVIIAHQDVRLIEGRTKLLSLINEMDEVDAKWGVLGNAGGHVPDCLAVRITDPHGANRKIGTFPQAVDSLDENLLIVRSDAQLGVSHDLDGFHLYGADMCIHAKLRGLRCYVVDFHVEHLSGGNKDAAFMRVRNAVIEKYLRLFRGWYVRTASTWLPLQSSRWSWRLRKSRAFDLLDRGLRKLSNGRISLRTARF